MGIYLKMPMLYFLQEILEKRILKFKMLVR